MNLDLNIQGFEQNLIEKKPIWDGMQYLFRFDNGYGASVVKHHGSYGSYADLWELAVIHFDDHAEWHLTYDTPITDDVEGFLEDEDVRNLLKQIRDLQKQIHEEESA